ncbi:MAG: FHA domain-containing protein [Eubacterium sp.]|nr:FHA domain-containing protein [Eubacterium sp.]
MAANNSELVKEIEELIRKYNKKPEKKIKKREIVELFQEAEIIVPCRANLGDNQVYDEYIEEVTLKPDVVKDGYSTRLLPVFTTYEQIPIDYMGKFSLIRMSASSAYAFMNESEELHGIVINPFTDSNMELRKKRTSPSTTTKSYVKPTPSAFGGDNLRAMIVYNNQRYNVAKSPFTIGRAGTDITIPETYISKVHAIISYKDGRYKVADYGSTNGTKLNGKELKPKVYYELRDGYEIQLSDKDKLIVYVD